MRKNYLTFGRSFGINTPTMQDTPLEIKMINAEAQQDAPAMGYPPHQVAVELSAAELEARRKAMTNWCSERHGAEDWAAYRRSAISPEPKDWIVFAFEAAEHADDFRNAWACGTA